MKRFNFLSVAVVLFLLVTAVSCTTMREMGDDEYYETNRTQSNRIYVDDPYRGVVVLERDPYTGRYYEVNSFGSYYGNGRYYGRNSVYSRPNVYRNNDRYYRNSTQYPRGSQTPQRPTEDQIRDREKSRDEARKKVLGN